MPTRRDFVRTAAAASLSSFGMGCSAARARSREADARSVAPDGAEQRAFRGTRAGDERRVDGIALCWCPPGAFVMGSPPTEPGRRTDEAQVDVRLSRGFWTARSEATQGQWRRIIGAFPDQPPSARFGEGEEYPVYWINFLEAERFCAALTDRARRAGELPDGWAFRLPTEAQWEYACRAGTVTATSFGDSISVQQANFGGDSEDRSVRARGSARPVASYPPNPWGIHDMHGNVWEWCRDWYHAHLPGGTDPDLYEARGVMNRDGTYSRVRRGGAWVEPGWACRSACRLRYEPPRRSDHIGFRIVAVELVRS